MPDYVKVTGPVGVSQPGDVTTGSLGSVTVARLMIPGSLLDHMDVLNRRNPAAPLVPGAGRHPGTSAFVDSRTSRPSLATSRTRTGFSALQLSRARPSTDTFVTSRTRS